MNKAQKKFIKVEKLYRFYKEIENFIETNQENYEYRMKAANESTDESDKRYFIESATEAIEENEALTELLNEIYKLM